MHALTALAPLLACPLAMLAMGAIGWFGTKLRRRGDRTDTTTGARG
jgi:hypothetical protein